MIIKDKKLLLVSGKGESIYWTPGGRFGADETSEQALKRELLEELNVSVQTAKFFMSAEYVDLKTGLKGISHYDLVKTYGEIKLNNEIDKFDWFSNQDFEDSDFKMATATVSSVIVPKLISMGLL